MTDPGSGSSRGTAAIGPANRVIREARPPAALITYGEGTTMHVTTKRATIGAAAIAAAGFFGSLPFGGTPVAQQGAPTVHRDVALVDAVDTTEIAYINAIHTDVVAPNGFEDSLLTAYGATNGPAYLDYSGTGAIFSPEYLNAFDGGATQLYDGYLADTVALEDEINGLLGVQAADQPALLAALQADYIGELPSTVTVGPNFDAALSLLGTTDDQAALSDFFTYGEYFLTNLASFSSDGLLTGASLEAGLSALEHLAVNLGGDFTSLVTGLFSSL